MSDYMKRFLRICAILLAVGLVYAGFTRITGIAIPCFFRSVTGLQCPACGVSRMSLRILRLDFVDAFYCNPFIFCTIPFIIFEIYMHARYGNKDPKWNKVLGIIYVIAALLFAVIRNVIA